MVQINIKYLELHRAFLFHDDTDNLRTIMDNLRTNSGAEAKKFYVFSRHAFIKT